MEVIPNIWKSSDKDKTQNAAVCDCIRIASFSVNTSAICSNESRTIGLIKGVDSYSFKHKTRLTTYCARCIENEILMFFRANKKNSKNISIDEPIGFDKEGNTITFLDILKTPNPDFVLDIHTKDNIKLLKKYFNVLTPRERDIIIKRYGLNDKDEVTQKEIAKEMGISRSYVSRIEKRALTKLLREFIKNNNN